MLAADAGMAVVNAQEEWLEQNTFPRVDFGFQGNVTFLGVDYRVNISVGRV